MSFVFKSVLLLFFSLGIYFLIIYEVSSWFFFNYRIRKMSGKLSPHSSPDIIAHYYKKSFITGVNDH